MITIDELKDLKVYSKQFYLPTIDQSKTGSAIFLLSPNIESSKRLMNSPLFINRKNTFQSYYMEKNVSVLASSKGAKNVVAESAMYYADYLEEAMSSSTRDDLSNSQFGLPKKRKYPLHDAKHVKLAAKFFNYVDKKDEKELARNIKRAAKKFNIELHPGKDNRLSQYITEDAGKVRYINNATNITKSYGIMGTDGSYNACVTIDTFDKPLRARSEVLVFKDDTVFVCKKDYDNDEDEYRVPGGGWNENEDPMHTAIRECQEEALMNIKNVKYCMEYIETYKTAAPWVREHIPEKDWWYGYYTKLYIAEYDSPYKGKVEDVDKDRKMATSGSFRPIKKYREKLNGFQQQAIDMYLAGRADIITESFSGTEMFLQNWLDAIKKPEIESLNEAYTSTTDEFAFYHVQQNYEDVSKMDLREDEYYSTIEDALNMQKHFGKFHVYRINHDHTINYLGVVDKYSDKWVWAIQKTDNKPNTLETRFQYYYIDKSLIQYATSIDYCDTFKDAFDTYTDDTGIYYVYTKREDDRPQCVGIIKKIDDDNWIVEKDGLVGDANVSRDVVIEDIQEKIELHNAFSYYYISDKKLDNDTELSEDDCKPKFYDAVYSQTTNNGIYYVYTIDKSGKAIYLGTINKFGNNWEWDTQEKVDMEPVGIKEGYDRYYVSSSELDGNVDADKCQGSIYDAIQYQTTDNGEYYVYGVKDDNSTTLIGTINRYGNNYDWITKESALIDVREVFSKDKVDISYLTNHIKFFGKKGKRRTNKVIRDIKNAVTDKDEKKERDQNDGKTPSPENVPTTDNTTPTVPTTPNNDENTSVSELYIPGINESLYVDVNGTLVFTEDAKNDPYLRRYFYDERLKQDKEVIAIYNQVKADVPYLKYTYTKLPRYQKKNLFYDVSFYNQLFFKNNTLTALKGLDIYSDLVSRMVNIPLDGYTRRTVFIPIQDWENNDGTKMWMYRNGYNPISIIYQGLITNPNKIVKMFGDMEVLFIDNKRYFKVNFSKVKDFKKMSLKFKMLIDKLQKGEEVSIEDKDPDMNKTDSKQSIVNDIIDKLEDSQGIKISNITGQNGTTSKEEIDKKIDSSKTITSKQSAEDIMKDQERQELLDAINKAADNASSTDDALDKLEDERIKQIIVDLASEDEETTNINAARASRMTKLQNDMYDIEVQGKTVKELLTVNTEREDLPVTSLKTVSGINKDEWENLSYVNFDKDYNINEDIMKIIDKLSTTQYPIAVRNIKVVDNSTSEDYVDLYTIEMEDFRGKRFTVRFDVPKFLPDGKYLLLRGNKKTIQNQLQNMPIIKTEEDTCQVISNYNKIFIRRFGSALGKSNPTTSRLLKALQKYNGKDITITYGDNRKVCSKYQVPVDYIDIGSYVSKIETDRNIFYLNPEDIKNEYPDINYTLGVPYGYDKTSKKVMYYNGNVGLVFAAVLKDYLCTINEFKELYDAATPSIRSTYSKCSILSTEIPLVIVCAYTEGLETTLKKANIEYKLTDKIDSTIRSKESWDYIKFKDGYLVYKNTYSSCMLMNGLKESATEMYSLADINSKIMYTDFLDNYGGRIKADGLENFYDCMIDPITKEVLEHLKLPTDYVEILVHANNLLADNKFIKHTDIATKRLRRKELIAVKVYKALFNDAYVSYANQLRHNKSVAQYTIKQSAVIDKFLADCTASDNSIINGINDVETANEVTSKGESGMNSDRAYSLDKRTYDKSMLNVLAMSTGFAGNVGITRQATIDMNVEGKRGYIKSINNNTDKMNTTKSLSVTEALNPFGTTSDYPFRSAMNFIQTAKHAMRTEVSDPLLVTNGTDEAMPYLVSDAFAFKAKQNGKIKEFSAENYIIIEYKDGTKDYVNLKKTTEKNSDGGFYVPMQLVPMKGIKEGKTVKANEIIAYDPTSFSNNMGENDNIAYDVGTLTKVAILNTDENFEDSAIVTEKLCEKIATKVIIKEDRKLSKDTNIYNLVKVGQSVSEGDTLLVYQNPYDEEDMNILLKNLVDDPNEISELGRIPMKSHVTGIVSDIKMYRTVELDELSESLRKAFNDYEKPIKAMKKKLDSEGISSSMLPATYTLPPTGKLKHAEDSIIIEIYVEVYDIGSIGDKIVFDRANKGVIKRIVSTDEAPYTSFRPNEEISAFAGIASFNARMVTSPLKVGSVNKLMVELDRSCKDILGIPYDDTQP